jgi:hypothetical protein
VSRTGQAVRRELSTGKREPNLAPSVIFSQHSSYPNDRRGLCARNYRIYTLARTHTQKNAHMRTQIYNNHTHTQKGWDVLTIGGERKCDIEGIYSGG